MNKKSTYPLVVPTITAENAHIYREQIENVEKFAPRIHIDLMDGVFTKNRSVGLDQVWWPQNLTADIHLMFDDPEKEIDNLIELKPNMVIVQAESRCDVPFFSAKLLEKGIKTGLSIFPETSVESINYILPFVHQVLIFSGNLGYQGGSQADFALLKKVEEIKSAHKWLSEIAWDGGVNDSNVKKLADAGINVINSGGFIQHSADPEKAYRKLVASL